MITITRWYNDEMIENHMLKHSVYR